jgi:hypothetical protein
MAAICREAVSAAGGTGIGSLEVFASSTVGCADAAIVVWLPLEGEADAGCPSAEAVFTASGVSAGAAVWLEASLDPRSTLEHPARTEDIANAIAAFRPKDRTTAIASLS